MKTTLFVFAVVFVGACGHGASSATDPKAPQPVAAAPAPSPEACAGALPDSARPALMTVTHTNGKPTLEEAAKSLDLAVGALDCSFGVVLIDPAKGLYSVRVDSTKLKGASANGPYSDPKIEPLSAN